MTELTAILRAAQKRHNIKEKIYKEDQEYQDIVSIAMGTLAEKGDFWKDKKDVRDILLDTKRELSKIGIEYKGLPEYPPEFLIGAAYVRWELGRANEDYWLVLPRITNQEFLRHVEKKRAKEAAEIFPQAKNQLYKLFRIEE